MQLNPILAKKILRIIANGKDGIRSISAKDCGQDNYELFAAQLDIMAGHQCQYISSTSTKFDPLFDKFANLIDSADSKVELMISPAGLQFAAPTQAEIKNAHLRAALDRMARGPE